MRGASTNSPTHPTTMWRIVFLRFFSRSRCSRPKQIETTGWATYFVVDAVGFALPMGSVAVFGTETKSNDLDEFEPSGAHVHNA